MNWLESLKEGDEVALMGGGFYSAPSIEKVARVTPTLVVVGNSRYRRSDGRAIGPHGRFGLRPEIVEPTKERRDAAEAARLRALIERTNFSKMPLESLRAVASAIRGAA